LDTFLVFVDKSRGLNRLNTSLKKIWGKKHQKSPMRNRLKHTHTRLVKVFFGSAFIATPKTRLLSLLTVVLETSRWKCITGQKLGQNWGRGHQIFTPNILDLTLQAPNHCAKCHENRMKIVAVGAPTDTLTERCKWL